MAENNVKTTWNNALAKNCIIAKKFIYFKTKYTILVRKEC